MHQLEFNMVTLLCEPRNKRHKDPMLHVNNFFFPEISIMKLTFDNKYLITNKNNLESPDSKILNCSTELEKRQIIKRRIIFLLK